MSAPPEPPEAGIVNGLRFATQTRRYLEGLQARFPDIARIPVPGRSPIVIVTSPDLGREVVSRNEDFGRIVTDTAALIAEGGLVQSEGDLWRQQRSVMAPAFAGRQVAAYADATGRRVEHLADRWRGGERRVDLHAAVTGTTVRVASEILMGEDIGAERARQFYEWMEVAGRQFEFGFDLVEPDWLPDRSSEAFEAAAEGIRGLAEELIERRRATLPADGDRPADVLTMLLRAEDDPEVELPPDQIRDEVATLLIAGHETTALSISYTLSLLSWHPEVRDRVRAEARRVLGDGPPTHEDVAELELTGRVYREALRLYPPAWAVFREANHDLRLGGYSLERGSVTVVPLWSIHRDGRHFEHPEAFDPDRWAERDPDSVDAYFPFSVGPHACIGRQFALSGATLVLARLVREFDVDVPRDELDDLRMTPTLRPVDGVDATVRPADPDA